MIFLVKIILLCASVCCISANEKMYARNYRLINILKKMWREDIAVALRWLLLLRIFKRRGLSGGGEKGWGAITSDQHHSAAFTFWINVMLSPFNKILPSAFLAPVLVFTSSAPSSTKFINSSNPLNNVRDVTL